MFSKTHPPTGARPGTLIISPNSAPSRVAYVRYGKGVFEEGVAFDIDDLPNDLGPHEKLWVDVQGFRNEPLLRAIANRFEIHPLATEDLVNVPQPPKSVAHGSHHLLITNVTQIDDQSRVKLAQIGMIFGEQFVLTFHNDHNDILDPVAQRLRLPTSRLRGNGTDYLAYVVLDTAVDTYYPVIDKLGRVIEELETSSIQDPRPELLQRINRMKNQISNLRRRVWPQREALHSLIRGDCELISDPVQVFLRDTYAHCLQTSDVIDMYREMASGLLNTYMSAVAHRSNEIMKFLTVVSSVFVPMTFVAGIYGMNFPNMPEFSYQYSYLIFWAIVLGISGSMLWFFLRRGWIKPSFLSENQENSVEEAAAVDYLAEKQSDSLSGVRENEVRTKRAA